jgi:hypothetical protein
MCYQCKCNTVSNICHCITACGMIPSTPSCKPSRKRKKITKPHLWPVPQFGAWPTFRGPPQFSGRAPLFEAHPTFRGVPHFSGMRPTFLGASHFSGHTPLFGAHPTFLSKTKPPRPKVKKETAKPGQVRTRAQQQRLF